MEEDTPRFIYLGDKLPTVYDMSQHIFYLSPGGSTTMKRKDVINQYTASLHDLWVRSFGKEYVRDPRRILDILSRIMVSYDKFRKTNLYGNAKRGIPSKNIRRVNKEWMDYCEEHSDELTQIQEKKGRPSKAKSMTVSDQPCVVVNESGLLDIGVNTEQLTGAERVFYVDQKGRRRFRVSTEIDEEYVKEKEQEYQEQLAQQEEDSANSSFANPEELLEATPSSSTPSTSAPSRTERYIKRSLQLSFEQDKSVTDSSVTDSRPEIRNVRNCKDAVKDAIATISYRCAISIEKARIAYQVVCLISYGHRYYLTPEEQNKFEPSTDSVQEQSKRPRTAKDYSSYKYVIPSAKVTADYKHNKALQKEIDAANALGNLEEGTKVTLHFDTTSRSRVEGEWPSLILNFLNDCLAKCRMIPLRALFFAYENREQIVKLIIETLKRLSVASGGHFSPKQLWENIKHIMTDSVSKNLKIEYGVAESLGSTHIPIHVLCKSHTCEKLDEACIKALVSVESEIDYPKLIIRSQPQLKSFVRQTKCIALAAIKAMLKLVGRDESAKPTSMAQAFDLQLEEDGLYKTMSLYKERRFTKLGYSAAAILDCLPQYEKILEKTTYTNVLVQACRLYCQSEYVCGALKALGYFTYKITMPFLNCVEQCDQNTLLPILKQLHDDLKLGKMDTLKDFHVVWTHIKTEILEPSSEFDYLLLTKMCTAAAEGIHMQCAAEYWEDTDNPRVTQLHHLSHEERKNIPTENIGTCERYLARFGGLAGVSAAKSNKFFKAKRIRDDLMFVKEMTDDEEMAKATKKVLQELKSMELTWTKEQKECLKEKIAESVKKNSRGDGYKEDLIAKCKANGGPVTSTFDVRNMVASITDSKKLKRSLKMEVKLQKILHPFDAKERSWLYKQNFLSPEELAENLTILLDTSSEGERGEDVCFPTEDEIFELLSKGKNDEESVPMTQMLTEEKRTFTPEEPLAVIWDNTSDERYWCLGFYVRDLVDEIQVDHLKMKHEGKYELWIRPTEDDTQPVQHAQILPVGVIGTWDLSKRQSVYTINNVNDIESAFNDFMAI